MKTIIDGLKLTFYIYSHPFDGFWVMKNEKKGNMFTAIMLFFLLVVTTMIHILCSGYLFSSKTLNKFSPWALAAVLASLIILYCVCNWALTTLIGGSANLKQIFIAVMYALTPVILFNIPIAVLSNALVLKEAEYISFLTTFSLLWTLALMIISNCIIHEFTMFKSIVTFCLTLIGMVIAIILGLFYIYIVQQFFVWIGQIFKELFYRL